MAPRAPAMLRRVLESTKTQLQIGATTIRRVVEIERWAFRPAELFPTISTATVQEAARRWGPGLLDPVSGELILGVQSFVLRTPDQVILVDSCNGNHKPRPNLPPHHMLDTAYLERLRDAGFEPAEVDVVVCTHLHPDHIGWNTRLIDGRWVPTFPNARYLLGHVDFEWLSGVHAAQPLEGVPADLASAFADSVLPVVESGQAVLVADDHVIEHARERTIRLEGAPGHTPGHVLVHVHDSGAHAVMCGDVIHHPLQLAAPDLPQAGDADPELAASTRRRLLDAIADTPTILVPAHFPGPATCRVRREGETFTLARRCGVLGGVVET
jgi:glyoxylase-like metal-dependent hydrolase (beta-lactamase superfamily II)